MDTSGKAHEGWMTVIPVSVLLVIVVVALGGPTRFVNTVSLWIGDMVAALAAWIKHF